MSEPGKLDQIFHLIMKRMVGSGQAPHYTEIACELGILVEEGRRALHDLLRRGFLDGYFRIQTTSPPSLLSTTFPHSIA
jgi:predicted DNA-binding transcriptional regulator